MLLPPDEPKYIRKVEYVNHSNIFMPPKDRKTGQITMPEHRIVRVPIVKVDKPVTLPDFSKLNLNEKKKFDSFEYEPGSDPSICKDCGHNRNYVEHHEYCGR